MSERLIVGVDSGGTRTRAAIASGAGRLLGVGAAGGGNPRDGGLARAAGAIDAAVAAAFADAGVARTPAAGATVGVAGVATVEEREALGRALAPLGLVAGGVPEIVHDLRVAHEGAFAGGPGLVLVAGTGSCCYGRGPDGRERRAGGWGARLDDGGSAAWLGLEAVRAAVRGEDGRGPATALAARVLSTLRVRDLRGALGVVEGAGYREHLARLGPVVMEEAGSGDAAAADIVERGARELASMVGAVASGFGGAMPVVCVGGVFNAGGLVYGVLDAALRAQAPGCERVAARLPGVLGALLMAAARLGEDGAAFGASLAAGWGAGKRENL